MLIDRKRALQEINISEKMFNELLNVFIEQTEPALKILEEKAEKENMKKSAKKRISSAVRQAICGSKASVR